MTRVQQRSAWAVAATLTVDRCCGQVNNSDLDLVEWENKDPKLGPVGRLVVMLYCWGQQHSNNGLALGIAEGGLAEFMASFW